MVISRSPGKGDHSLARNRNYPPTPLLIAQPGCATSRPPSQLRRFPASSQLLIPGLAKPAIACAAGKPRGSTVGDACRSPVKGQRGRHPPPPPPCTPAPSASRSLHQGVHPGGSPGTGSCVFGLFGFSASPPGTGSPWHGGGAEAHAEKPQKLWEKCLGNAGWSQRDLPWGQKKKALRLIKYILIQLIPGEEKVCSANSQKPQESRLLQNRKFRKGFPHSPQKHVFIFSRRAFL